MSATWCDLHGRSFVPSQCDWSDEPFCPDCDTAQSFSDLYKDETGIRPNLAAWTLAEQRQWVESHTS
jgi:hypothetical protein